jgi:ABC-type multidrug transport system fused ATPase/permease subunit
VEAVTEDHGEARPRRSRPIRELLSVLRPYTRPERRYVVAIALCLFAGLPLAWTTPVLVQRVFDVAVRARDFGAILAYGVLMAAVTWGEAILALVRGICTTRFHTKSLHRLRLDLFRGSQALKLGAAQSRETGALISVLSDDVANLDGVMADRFGAAIAAVVRFVVVGAILVTKEWRLAVIAAAGAIVLAVLNAAYSGPLRRRGRDVREAIQDLNVAQHQSITGHALVRATANETFELRRYGAALAGAVRAIARRDLFGLWTGHPSVVLGGLLPGVVLLFGAAFIAEGAITQGDLFAMFIFLGQFFDAAMTLARLNPGFQTSLASLDRIADLLDSVAVDRQPTGTRVIERIHGDVAFSDVHFGYGPAGSAPEVLHGISFAAKAGQTVAVVGRSGAGKSTLLSLIPRFADPWSGTITIDGVPLSEIDVRRLRRQIGIVPQDVFLFDRSIRENIAYGSEDPSDRDVEDAALAAYALEFIRALPGGFETKIGERGVRLSGGQRQRIAIAREILRAPRILILDEATSSLDSETERDVHRALERLLADRTAFIIAHRLSTVMNADLILFLEGGRLIASGGHADLLRMCPAYRDLALLQSLGAEGAVGARP